MPTERKGSFTERRQPILLLPNLPFIQVVHFILIIGGHLVKKYLLRSCLAIFTDFMPIHPMHGGYA